jgi:hypothetical protein
MVDIIIMSASRRQAPTLKATAAQEGVAVRRYPKESSAQELDRFCESRQVGNLHADRRSRTAMIRDNVGRGRSNLPFSRLVLFQDHCLAKKYFRPLNGFETSVPCFSDCFFKRRFRDMKWWFHYEKLSVRFEY